MTGPVPAWMIPAAIVVVCLVVMAGFAYLGRDLIGRRYHQAAEDELQAAQRWIRMVDDRREPPPVAEWEAFCREERERIDAERQRLAVVVGISDAGDPEPKPEPAEADPWPEQDPWTEPFRAVSA